MKTIKIKQIQLINFKGIRDFVVNFTNDEEFIFGANGTGKTSIFDAFNWLLFGKDSNGRSDFEVKTLDAQNKVIEKIEHEVNCDLVVDGQPVKLRRVLKESWVKKRGATLAAFTGNITEYYWNDVPVQQKEYQSNISSLLDEQVFKLVTNTMAFNSLPWKDRRNILAGMVSITDEEIINENKAFIALMDQIKGHKSIEDFKKMKMASIKKAKEDLANIPTRIDEVSRMKPEAKDFFALKVQLEEKQMELKVIDEQIQDKTKAVEAIITKSNDHALKVNGVKQQISSTERYLMNEVDKKVAEGKTEFNQVTAKLKATQEELDSSNTIHTALIRKKDTIQSDIEAIERQMADKRQEWANENARVFSFNRSDCKCPTCERSFETSDIDAKETELKKNFITDQEKKLASIQSKGQQLKAEKDVLELTKSENENKIVLSKKGIETLNTAIVELKTKLETLKTDTSSDEKMIEMIYDTMVSNDVVFIELKKDLAELEKITFENTTVDNTELKAAREVISKSIDTIKEDLEIEKQIKTADERIVALKKEEETLSQQVADVENLIMIAEDFSKAKIDAVENKINQRFKFVKFKMFDTQVNGGEAECCEVTINGVPFSDANTASKINAGIDIINTLSEFYQVTAPIFIDNRESVTNVLPTNTQRISLIVSPEDKKLRVA